jgi:hypothetical protein
VEERVIGEERVEQTVSSFAFSRPQFSVDHRGELVSDNVENCSFWKKKKDHHERRFGVNFEEQQFDPRIACGKYINATSVGCRTTTVVPNNEFDVFQNKNEPAATIFGLFVLLRKATTNWLMRITQSEYKVFHLFLIRFWRIIRNLRNWIC